MLKIREYVRIQFHPSMIAQEPSKFIRQGFNYETTKLSELS